MPSILRPNQVLGSFYKISIKALDCLYLFHSNQYKRLHLPASHTSCLNSSCLFYTCSKDVRVLQRCLHGFGKRPELCFRLANSSSDKIKKRRFFLYLKLFKIFYTYFIYYFEDNQVVSSQFFINIYLFDVISTQIQLCNTDLPDMTLLIERSWLRVECAGF